MARVVGIDPGTKSFDLCGLDDGEVFYQKVVATQEVAENPLALIEAVEEVAPLDLIVGPSGYGVELTELKDIPLELLEKWYYNYILLTSKEEIEEAVEKGVFGALIYYAMTKTALEMKKKEWPVFYAPGVIELPTVPEYRKVNKLDMGTTDKLAIGVLANYDQARKFSLHYSECSFILTEVGFGYNAILGCKEGKIVDGIGGTTMSGPGFLTAGSLDLELVQLVKNWAKEDVFLGGGSSISGKMTPEELVKDRGNEEKCELAWQAMMEPIIKGVKAMEISVPEAREILLSGRLTEIKEVQDFLKENLSGYPVREVGSLDSECKVKRAAQGYAILASALAGDKFKDLIEWMEIPEAKGTAIDYIYHPRGKKIKESFVPFKP